jgi:branched-chain amino acid transport system ATP-binding protein
MLKVNKLRVFYDEIEAVKGIAFQVDLPEIITIIGANGAGKSSTLFGMIGVVAKTGQVILNDQDLTHLAPHKIVERGIVLVPEGRQVLGTLNVQENLEMGAYIRKDDFKSDLNRIYDQFPRLRERRKQLGNTLSGGEQQMLAIARGLMAKPKIMLLDEPSMGLAPKIVDQVYEIILSIYQEGTSIILVEQNASRAFEVAKRGYVMERGKIVKEGATAVLKNDPEVLEAYLT